MPRTCFHTNAADYNENQGSVVQSEHYNKNTYNHTFNIGPIADLPEPIPHVSPDHVNQPNSDLCLRTGITENGAICKIYFAIQSAGVLQNPPKN